ncbi:hypothetical protein EJ02DRAFT_458564 [Clathrospora elynae]|uniref:Uncharacterized protein n=1 Tax=Clathrospora elynae TaxID=706981 RepID=A0A6A5SJY1_9PLEO|nr:hypothetical protein EJ02DRAFT_458564 [Clathrospora elynae]
MQQQAYLLPFLTTHDADPNCSYLASRVLEAPSLSSYSVTKQRLPPLSSSYACTRKWHLGL